MNTILNQPTHFTLYDLLETVKFLPDELTIILIQLDSSLKYIHEHGYCVTNFDPKKIIVINGHITPNSFRDVISYNNYENAATFNIFQFSKIGLLSYNNLPPDTIMNQEHFNYLRENLDKYNQNGYIPKEIFEYYQEIFLNLHIDYLNNYLVKKQQEKQSNQNNNSIRKSLATDIGRAFVDKNEAAFLQVLFIPSIIALTYLLSLFIYIFIIK